MLHNAIWRGILINATHRYCDNCNHESMKKNLTLVDVFCGAGGLSEGFRRSGFDSLLGIDCDAPSIRTYEKYHGVGLADKIENVSASKIKKLVENQHIDVLSGGPPCQAFSTIACAKLRSMGRSTNRRHPLNTLYREFFRLVTELKPSFFVMENVPRMFSLSDGIIKEEIESVLHGRYKVNFYHEDVVNFGVPQFRKRVLAIGNKLDLENPILQHTHFDPFSNPSRKHYRTVRDAISDLPKIKTGGGSNQTKYDTPASSSYQRMMRRNSHIIHDHAARVHNERDLKIFKMLKPGQRIKDIPKKYNPYRKDIFQDRFKKLPWNKPSWTIIAHISKDGLMHIHPDKTQNRSITPREAARLQSFPDYYIFEGTRTQQFVQIGNAVPPLFADAIAKSITECMTIKPKIFSRKSK